MADNNHCDVAIIGGGLAGLSLAILLAQQQYSVIVFEKDDYPRHKVCGEYISMESYPFLQRLGLPLADMQLPMISQLILTDSNGSALHTALPQGGFGISRYLLDDVLAKQAVASGVRLLTRTRVDDVTYHNDTFTIHAGGQQYTAPVACGAWGKRANIDVKWLRPFTIDKHKGNGNYVGIKYHVRIPWQADTIALHNFRGGYCGISRIEDDKCCLCYLTTAATLKANDNDIKQMERDVLMQNPELKKIFTEAEFLYSAPVTISQVSFRSKDAVHDHVLLLGDAAGMITPLCGNGMSIALHTASIAHNTIIKFFSTKNRHDMEYVYRAKWRKEFGMRIYVGRILQKIFDKTLANNIFLSIFKLLPFLHKPLIRCTSGKPF